MLRSCITLVLLFACALAFAQNIQTLPFPGKDTLIANSLYNKILLVDARQDTTSLGFVQTGAFNKRATVKASQPIGTHLSEYLSNITDTSAQNGGLLLRLRQYEISEITGAVSERGYCRLDAILYAQNGERYQKVVAIDTVYTVKGGMDVTRKLLSVGGGFLTAFVRDNLHSKPSTSESYSFTDIKNFEEQLKQQLKLYTTDKFVDGVYLSFNSFKNQIPDKPIKVDGYIAYPGVVKQVEADGKAVKLKGQNAYAIVFMGRAYITTRSDYYEIRKVNNELLFTGQVREAGGTTQMIAASMFGVLGALMAANSTVPYEMKIDPSNGRFVALREMPNKAEPTY